jgi:hypothetical protein
MFKKSFLACTILALSACSGGGGSSGATPSNAVGTTSGGTTTPPGSNTNTQPLPLTSGIGGVTTQTGGAVSIDIGFNNLIQESPDKQQYLKDYQIKIVDNSGFPIKNASVTLRIDVVSYGKGFLIRPVPTTGSIFNFTTECPNEDINKNDILDAGEDTNSDGRITPARAVVSLQAPNGLITNDAGVVTFQMQYSKRNAAWHGVQLTVTSSVNGTEGRASEVFGLPFTAGDQNAPGAAFAFSPYGESASCADRL